MSIVESIVNANANSNDTLSHSLLLLLLVVVVAASLSFLVVFLQTLASQLDYDNRAKMHKNTATDLRDLREDLENIVNRSTAMMHSPGGDNYQSSGIVGGANGNDSKEENEEFIDEENQTINNSTSLTQFQN